MTLTESLLTENRYWTFWSLDWTKRVNVYWGGTVKWTDVKKTVAMKYFKGIDHGYERQVQLKEPDISFA